MLKKIFITDIVTNFICALIIVTLSFTVSMDSSILSVLMYTALALLMIKSFIFQFLKKKYGAKEMKSSTATIFKGLYVVTILLYGLIGFPFPVFTSLICIYLLISDMIDYRTNFI